MCEGLPKERNMRWANLKILRGRYLRSKKKESERDVSFVNVNQLYGEESAGWRRTSVGRGAPRINALFHFKVREICWEAHFYTNRNSRETTVLLLMWGKSAERIMDNKLPEEPRTAVHLKLLAWWAEFLSAAWSSKTRSGLAEDKARCWLCVWEGVTH